MSKIIILIIGIAVVVTVIFAAGYFLIAAPGKNQKVQSTNQKLNETSELSDSNNQVPKDNATDQSNQIAKQSQQTTQPSQTYQVMYTNSGYSPSQLTLLVGDTVTFKNQSSGGMWVASAMHPSHKVYGGTSLQEHCPDTTNMSFDQCKSSQPGESWSFTFEKAGTWGYHNHIFASNFGKVIVK